MKHTRTALVALLCFISFACHAQDPSVQAQPGLADKLSAFPSKFFSRINDQTAKLNAALTRQTQQYLKKLARQEARIRKQLYKKDSTAAKKLFAGPALDYTALAQKLQNQSMPLAPGAGGKGIRRLLVLPGFAKDLFKIPATKSQSAIGWRFQPGTDQCFPRPSERVGRKNAGRNAGAATYPAA